MTALLDAIGLTIARLDEYPTRKRVLVIMTDGAENASVEYKHDQIREMVEDRQQKGWDVMFLGAGLDAIAEAQKIGVAPQSTASYAASYAGTQSAHNITSNYITRSVTTPIGATNAITDEEREALEQE
jgi:hypothetical protein